MGDEGSGYDIGIRALRAATNAADRSGPPTTLERAIPLHFGLDDLWALHKKIYSGEFGRPQIAEIAWPVGDAANAGDGPALRILRAAGEDLANQALAVLERLDALDENVAVVTAGGVFRVGTPFVEPFQHAVNRRAPRARVHPPLFPPIVGAALLALRDLGRPLDPPLLDRLRAGLELVTAAK
jgi:N-acetylglucosamine kinase-like BadF-type ATPase